MKSLSKFLGVITALLFSQAHAALVEFVVEFEATPDVFGAATFRYDTSDTPDSLRIRPGGPAFSQTFLTPVSAAFSVFGIEYDETRISAQLGFGTFRRGIFTNLVDKERLLPPYEVIPISTDPSLAPPSLAFLNIGLLNQVGAVSPRRGSFSIVLSRLTTNLDGTPAPDTIRFFDGSEIRFMDLEPRARVDFRIVPDSEVPVPGAALFLLTGVLGYRAFVRSSAN